MARPFEDFGVSKIGFYEDSEVLQALDNLSTI
jgi:hypothetical protein